MGLERWKKLTAKKHTMTFDGTQLTVHGLTFTELGELAAFHDKKDNTGAMNYLLRRTFVKAPEVKDDEIEELVDNIGLDIAQQIVEKVQDLSGVKTPKKQDESEE